MSARGLSVVRLGEGRVAVRGTDAASLDQMRAWLTTRREVAALAFDPAAGVVDVRYADRGTQGTFLRALTDIVVAVSRPSPAPRGIARVHSLPGRVRLRVVGDAVQPDEAERLAARLAALPGVMRTNASPGSDSVVVVYDTAVTTEARILEASTGDDLPVPTGTQSRPEAPAAHRREWVKTAVNTAVLAACVAEVFPPVALAVGVAITAVPPVKRAIHALARKHVSVDLLDVAAIGISVATGQPGTAAFITWLLGIGDVLLAMSAEKARKAISQLLSLEANEAWRVTDGRTERVAAEALAVGDVILVEAGQRIAADGVVLAGTALVDEKALTGESMPRVKTGTDRVLAATCVTEGRLTVQVERTGTDTTAAKIVKILEGASSKPMTLQRDAERVADRLVLPTFGVAGLASTFAQAVEPATSVLITDFGTGIRIAVPTSALVAMTLAARRGVLVKGAQYLERMARADVVVFDKTGTLTSGHPEITHIDARPGFTPREVLALGASAEARQSHPIADAFRRRAERDGVALEEPEHGSEVYEIGQGLAARVGGRMVHVGGARWMAALGVDPAALHAEAGATGSTLWLAVDGALAGCVRYADALRPEAVAVVTALRAKGRRRVVLLSGDAHDPVRAVARAVGADEAVGELLPEDKAAFVRKLQREGRVVAMVGDGINDAPALALADVGISLHGGTDVALETADVVLLEGGLARLPGAFSAGDRAMRQVRRSLLTVIVPNAGAIVLGAVGLLSPALAAVINNGTTVAAAGMALLPLVRDGRGKEK